MANEFIVRKGYIALEDSQITGSLSVTNSVTASFFTGSYRGDGSQLTGIEGFPFTGSAGITGSLTVVGPVNATTFTGDGSQLTGIEGFPFTGSAKITGSLEVTGSVTATSFTGSLQGTATTASYVQLANIDGFTAYSASVNTAIDSVLDATTPLTATVNTTNSPFTITSQSIVIIDSTDGDVTVNLPDLNAINGTPDQKPILLYKNDYSQNVIYVEPSGSQLVNGTTQDIIVSIQIAIAYNPTSAGWVTEGTSYQSLAELELFFVPRTETGSFATTGSNHFSGSQTITGSLTVTGNITGNIIGSASTASYVEYTNVANKPALVSGSSQISFNGITDKPTLVSGSSQITYSGLTGIPSGILSGSAQIANFGIFATTGSNQFNGNQSITGSLTVSGQVVAQTLNVQQVTSSIVYSSGSNVFGNSLANTQQLTGSVGVTGSLTVAGAGSFSSTLATGGNITVTANSAAVRVTESGGADLRMVAGGSSGFFGTYSNHPLQFLTDSDTKMTLNTSGNLGLGVTPSAWLTASGRKAIEIGALGNAMFGNGASDFYMLSNAFTDGTFKYANNGPASSYRHADGAHIWYQAPSGTAGNAISFTQAMTLNSLGNLGLGVTPNSTMTVIRSMQLGYSGIIAGQQGTAEVLYLGSNWYFDGAFRYQNNGFATRFLTSQGAYEWGIAPSGTAGNAISFTQAMTLNASGRLLLGTTSDDGFRLNVTVSSTSDGIAVRKDGSNKVVLNGDGVLLWGPSANTGVLTWDTGLARINAQSTNDLDLTTSGGGRIILKSAGNVGIGTTSPTVLLNIERSISGTSLGDGMLFKMKNTSTTTNTRSGINFGNIDGIGGSLAMQSAILKNAATGEYDMTWDLYGGAAGWQEGILYIDSNPGRVGIGTTNPSERLEVNGSLRLNDGNADGPQLKLASSGYSDWNIDNFSGNLRAYYGSSEYLRVTSGGNVLIGTTTDNGRKLNVNGAGLFSGTLSTAKVEVGAVNSVNITTNSTFTLIPSGNFNIRTNILVSVTIRWDSNANAQRQYLLFIGATDTGWGTPNSAISVIASNDWSSGYVGAASFSIGGSGQSRTLNISVSNAATYNVTAFASIVDM